MCSDFGPILRGHAIGGQMGHTTGGATFSSHLIADTHGLFGSKLMVLEFGPAFQVVRFVFWIEEVTMSGALRETPLGLWLGFLRHQSGTEAGVNPGG